METESSFPQITSALQLSLFWVIYLQHIPLYLTSWKSILIIFSYLHLGLKIGIYSLSFPHQRTCRRFSSHPHTLYNTLQAPTQATSPPKLFFSILLTENILGGVCRSLLYIYYIFFSNHMQSHSSKELIFSTSSLITTKPFITNPVYIYNERLLPFLRQFLLIFCVKCWRTPNANTQNNGFI